MTALANILFILILTLNLFALGNGRILSVIKIVAMQGLLLGLLPLLLEQKYGVKEIASALTAVAIKAVIIPGMMAKALRDVQIKREVEPYISLLASIILGAFVTSLAFLFFTEARFSLEGAAAMILPASMATVVVGFIMLVTRYKALSQVLGYLVLENGIYIFSLLLLDAIPIVIELGMLLDLFVSVFVVSIITNHINQAFASLDTRKLSVLKE